MKRFAAWLTVLLLICQTLGISALASGEEDWTEVISGPVDATEYHLVRFTAGDQDVLSVFALDGETVESLPEAPAQQGKSFIGWYQGNTLFTARTPVHADVTVRAVYAEVDAALEAEKRAANFVFTDEGRYARVTIFGTHKKNQAPSATRSTVQGGMMLDAWTVKNLKNNTHLMVEAVITALPEDGTLSAYTVKSGKAADRVGQDLDIGDRVVFALSQKGAAGLALMKEGEAPVEEIEGALYANEHLYITGKVPGNGIIEVIPVTAVIEDEEVVCAYDISIYANEKQQRKGKTWQPASKKVQVHFFHDAFKLNEEYSVYHMQDASNEAELVDTVKPDEEGWITFEAASFSVYVITRTRLNETVQTSDGATYDVEVTYTNRSGIPMEGTALKVSEILPEDARYAEYVAASAGALDTREKNIAFARAFDIKIVSAQDPAVVYEPVGDVSVRIRLIGSELENYDSVGVLHFAGDGLENAERVNANVSGETVGFVTDGFSVYVVAGYTMETQITAGDGNTYRITLTFQADALLPEDAALVARELTEAQRRNYLVDAAIAMDAAGFAYGRVFDISIADGEGNEMQPSVPVDVRVELMDAADGSAPFSVVHFREDGGSETPELVPCESEDGAVSFAASGFSAYAIVQGPESLAGGTHKASSLGDLSGLMGKPLYICQTDGYYLKAGEGRNNANNTTGILKTPKAAAPSAATDPAQYYLESAGAANTYYIYCMSGGKKLYIYNENTDSLYLRQDQKTAFTVSAHSSSRFSFKKADASRYFNMWEGANGKIFAAYTRLDNGGYFNIWYSDQMEDDPYHLDGVQYGLMNWSGSASGRALMANSSGTGALSAKQLTVMTEKHDHNDQLFVPNDSDITQWTFHWSGDADKYYLTAEVGGASKYLRLASDGLTLADAPDDACKLQVLPGSGVHAGQICLKGDAGTLTYSGEYANGFTLNGSAGQEWLYMVSLSELTADYFRTYSATKVSVSDPGVTNGSRVILYTRVWNDSAKQYEFYAMDHDGTLVRCYESGDSIEWVGQQLNTMLWNLVEYYDEATGQPNYYYELFNPYSEKFIAPKLAGGQILQSGTIGLNLNGRRNGGYYTSIVAWDGQSYAYTGLKTVDGKVVPCAISEAEDFYFAVVEAVPTDDVLHTVPTLDHTQYGITMKLVNFGTRKEMSDFLGNDAYTNGRTTAGLLSTDLKGNGYPTAKGGSLASWFAGAQEVNHLFIASTYHATGYYEYDSVQNFASLHGSNFTVYKELGSMDSTGDAKWYKHGQFLPYNDLTPGLFASVNRYNTTYATGATLPDSDPRKYEQLYLVQNPDYYLGAEIGASFTMTPDGLDNWGHDIIYEFTGDDDFWLYVDGELVIDLGGIHDALPGSVNYRTGEVRVNGTRTTLYDLFYNNYLNRGHSRAQAQAYVDEIFTTNAQGQHIFKEYTTHTMKIFYLERGAGASNLHMRFNLASVKRGTVELTKELTGVDSTESVLAEFPYQIWYRLTDGSYAALTQNPNGGSNDVSVVYKDTTMPVPFRQSYTVDGVTYQNVYLLKPGETAVINLNLPHDVHDSVQYRIVECGVNTEVFDTVSMNGEELRGTREFGTGKYPSNRRDFATEYATANARARVAYNNHVDSNAVRDLTITKKLYREDGVTPIQHLEDGTTFSFRLYLGTESGENLSLSNMHTYHVKDPSGNYCRWDAAAQTFVSLGKRDYSRLTAAEKEAASFHTSINGSISNIPVSYTVEVRELLAGTRYQVEERESEIPDGYSLQKYTRYDQRGGAGVDTQTPASGTALYGKDPAVDVCNLRGWGLRVNKLWSDADYMAERAPTYFALYAEEAGSLTLIRDSVRILRQNQTSLYWYYLRLPYSMIPFDHYRIREVTVTDPVVNAEGIVTSFGAVTPIPEGGEVSLSGKQKGETAESDFAYTVLYNQGAVSYDANVRVDTVTNNRPGIVLRKTDWFGSPLAGAVFTLTDESGSVIGTFTSDAEGAITTAFLRDDVDYTLNETEAPEGYRGLPAPMTVRLSDGTVTIGGVGQEYYELDQGEGKTPTLTVKNSLFTLKAVKADGLTGRPLAGARFALHRQRTTGDTTAFDVLPMPGFEDLITSTDGLIPRIDEELEHRVYELREIEGLEGYQMLTGHVHFTISRAGIVSLLEVPAGVTLTEERLEDGSFGYTITIPNYSSAGLIITKQVTGTLGDRQKDFTFTLVSVSGEDTEGMAYPWTKNAPDGTETAGSITTLDGGNTFTLRHGESIVITLPMGRQVILQEDDGANGMYAKVWTNGASITRGDTLKATLDGAHDAYIITNSLDAVSPTGYRAEIAPYAAMLLGGLAVLALALRKRRKQDGADA